MFTIGRGLIGAASYFVRSPPYRFVSQSFPRGIFQIYTNSLEFDQNTQKKNARLSFLADLAQVTGQTERFL